MLHTNSRGEEGIFYKVPGRMGVYTLKVTWIHIKFDVSSPGDQLMLISPHFFCRRTSQMWQRSCLKKGLRRAATIFLTPKAEKTKSVRRAKEGGGCEKVGLVFKKIGYFVVTQMTVLSH